MKEVKIYRSSTWRLRYWMAVGFSGKDISKLMKDNFDKDHDYDLYDGGFYPMVTGGSITPVIWTRKKGDISSLVHECVHAASWTLMYAGWEHDPKNDEPRAYLTQELFDAALSKP